MEMVNLTLKISVLITRFVTNEPCHLRESSQSLNFLIYTMLQYYSIGCLRNKTMREKSLNFVPGMQLSFSEHLNMS